MMRISDSQEVRLKSGRFQYLPAIAGMNFPTLFKVLLRNRFDVDRSCWGRLAIMAILGIMNSALSLIECLYYGRNIQGTRLEKPPLFIIGHPRSGTTHLHNLIRLDDSLDCPTVYQAIFPHHFCFSQLRGYRIFDRLAPHKRPMDNMPLRAAEPYEDEFALLALSGVSPYLRFLFPRSCDPYAAIDPRQLPPKALEAWRKSLQYYLKKVSWWKHHKRLVLKSPPHLGRMEILLQTFPRAQFIHIVRNPYTVYLSTRRLWFHALSRIHLQMPSPELVDEIIFSWYAEYFSVFERDRSLAGPRTLFEMKYEDLEIQPLETLRTAYEALGLPGFDRVRDRLTLYLEGIRDYQKNEFQLEDETRAKVSRRWGHVFARYGYQI